MLVSSPVVVRGAPTGAGTVVSSLVGPAPDSADAVRLFPPPRARSSAAISSAEASAAGTAPSGVTGAARRTPGRRSSSSGSNVMAAPPARAATYASALRSSNSSTATTAGSTTSGLGGQAGGALAGALHARVCDQRADQPDGPDRVVVGRDDVVELVRIDVRVARPDDRDLELARLGDGDPLAMRVDDEHRPGQALHLADAAERSARACSAPRSASRLPSSGGARSRRPAGAPRAARAGRCAS